MMRFALCDDDQLYTRMIELMLTDLEHEVVGVARSTADAVGLITSARPDVVILDLSLGYNHDFDIVHTANRVGARSIVFSHNADESILGAYDPRPVVVHKPDLTDLERVVRRLSTTDDPTVGVSQGERRVRPGRAADGRVPTNVSDAQAFYEALNGATAGDVLVSVEVPNTDASWRDTTDLATKLRQLIRDTDRLLASPWSVRIFLPGAGDVGADALVRRFAVNEATPAEAVMRHIVVEAGEDPVAAFDRLRALGQER